MLQVWPLAPLWGGLTAFNRSASEAARRMGNRRCSDLVVATIRNSMGPREQGATDERKAALVGRILRGELTPQEACEREGLSSIELKRWVRAYTRAARRAVDDQVAAALAAHGLEVDERPAAELSGTLDGMGLPDLIQTIQYGKKDAQIRIEHEG